MYIKKFKNGNFNIGIDAWDLESEQTFIEWVVDIVNDSSADFALASDLYEESTTARLYNYNTQQFYAVDDGDHEHYRKGKVVKIEGFKDEYLYNELVEDEIL